MSILEAIILGLVQGLAEFLPISSSAHLAILQDIFGIEGGSVLTFTVLLHLGTLIAVFIAYWDTILELIFELGRLIRDIFTGKGFRLKENETRKLGIMILIATIPAGVIGLLLNDFVEAVFTSMTLIGLFLIVTGVILWFAERVGKGDRPLSKANFRNAFTVGIFQAVALLPGISRSGSTIVGGLFLGFTKELAVKFAFLISIPSVLGAVLVEIPDAIELGLTTNLILPTIIGVIVAAVSGFIAIKTMVRVVTSNKLFIFSIYTWVVGAAVVIWSLVS